MRTDPIILLRKMRERKKSHEARLAWLRGGASIDLWCHPQYRQALAIHRRGRHVEEQRLLSVISGLEDAIRELEEFVG